MRPHPEGSNIGSWIGFKHINYLVEEAVLEHFRAAGLSARSLYADHAIGLEVVDLDTRIITSFHTDDLVRAVVTTETGGGKELAFTVRLSVERDGDRRNAVRSQARVLLRRDRRGGPADPVPVELAPMTVDRIVRTAPDPTPIPSLPLDVPAGNAFAWHRRVPYFHCHFTERLRMSGYLRQMEEVVDMFLADRGVSIKRLLDEQGWIPVVSHSWIAVLDEALMEEDLYTVFTVENVFKNLTYTARMDTYVLRDGHPLRTSTGRITHGYAEIVDRHAMRLVEFDARLLSALRGG